jgi:hypothetical protein
MTRCFYDIHLGWLTRKDGVTIYLDRMPIIERDGGYWI